MPDRGLNSADTSQPGARHAVALGLVLVVGVTVAGAALGGVAAAESQSSPVEISDWTDLQAINDSQANLSDDYVLVNDLNKSTAGYNAVVLNQTATEFTEDVFFDSGESRVNLTRTPVAELLSNDEGLNLTVVDSANGTIERENTSSFSDVDVTYNTSTERFVGFSPIGGPSLSERFWGSFDGQGNTIRDLLIDRPTDADIGLFGSSEGTIEQVTLANATITGFRFVGGLVGSNDGTVSTSSASGAVNSTGSAGGLVAFNTGTVSNSSASGAVNGSRNVGGLVGGNSEGTVSNSSASGAVNGSSLVGGLVGGINSEGTVSNSSASGDVNGSESYVGGLVGSNPEGTVSNSSASGAVNGSSLVGGLVGSNDGTVSNSSASGAVNGSSLVGGLVGWNFEGAVSESFATGAVTGSSNVGGLVGQLGFFNLEPGEEAILRDSYYDNQTTGQQVAVGTIEEGDGTAELRGEVAGLPTSQMQGASAAQNMAALDFTSTWEVVTNPPGYPELRSLPDGPDPEPPLTAGFTIPPENPTVGEQLTLDADPSTPESDIESYDWTLGDGTTATGKQVTHTYTNSGQFTVELTVQNGTETDTATETISVSPPSSPVEISDWTDLDDIRNDTDADYVLVNDLNKSTAGYNAVVLNQTATEFTEEVRFDSGESRVNLTRTPVAELLSNNAGLNLTVVDSANGTIERESTSSSSSVAVTYTTPTERFVGFSPIGPSFSERFTGSFGGQGNTIRDLLIDRPTDADIGLFGSSEGTIEQVTLANATITGSSFVGGLVGANDGTVSNSSASGAVNGSDNVGGLVGGNSEGTVSNSSASGAVTGSDIVGGLVGSNSGGTVSTSSASGAVTGSSLVGGLVGWNSFGGTVSNSFASGVVTGSGFSVGGLVGSNSGETVSNSSASGAVTGSSLVGGLVGDNDGTVSESFATGAVTGSSSVGGLVGRNSEGTVTGAYWDIQATGQSQSAGGIGLNTSQMQGASAAQNMGALDFTNSWRVVTDPPGYPELQDPSDGPDPGPPSLPGQESPPQDLDGNGLYEDIDGDESFDIFDVQALFEGLNSDPVQNNPAAFNFNDDDNPEEVTIFDVQGLFELLD